MPRSIDGFTRPPDPVDYRSTTAATEIADDNDNNDDNDQHKTTFLQTFIHLLKGYVGCGVLSLPWAVSQLGIPGGCLIIFAIAYWSSYNCWTIVKLKRYIERSSPSTLGTTTDETASEAASSNITYPDLGDWAYGKQFQTYVTACICTQQLAICTVFLSFIGENLLAVLQFFDIHVIQTHFGVISVALPFVLALSFIPDLKKLASVMAAATVLIMVGFASLGIIGMKEWSDRPDVRPTFSAPQAPLAICAILYSYEGINLILPVESAMKEPKYFQEAFVLSMTVVAFIFASVASLSVFVFGNVTNGSITAFLLEEYRNDATVTLWLMIANTAVSFSILLTYPLQLWPAIELTGPWLKQIRLPWQAIDTTQNNELDLGGFEPLPPLPEHDTASMRSLPSQHEYGGLNNLEPDKNNDDDEDDSSRQWSTQPSASWICPTMSMPGDSPQLRVLLVCLTYIVAVAVPNVQSLISLAGAVAGSSTALLIPPILELAWIRHLERHSETDDDGISFDWWLARGADKYRWERVKSWFLLCLGLIFALVGSVASISDIIRIYSGHE